MPAAIGGSKFGADPAVRGVIIPSRSTIVETGPDPATDGVVRWRRVDLQRVIEKRFGVVHSERAITDLLKALSFSYISGRPKHPGQDPRVLETFKKTSRARSRPT